MEETALDPLLASKQLCAGGGGTGALWVRCAQV